MSCSKEMHTMIGPGSVAAWSVPPLLAGEVRVFSLDVRDDKNSGLVARALAVLSAAEQERAARFRKELARREFVAGRGCLRMLLAANCAGSKMAQAGEIGIEAGSSGKPEVAAGFAGYGFPEFNVAHSRGLVLIALSRAGAVGIDVEFMDEGMETVDIARGAFAPGEIEAIERAAEGAARVRMFYSCWTRKEAVAKADGRGLTLALDGFSVEPAVAVAGLGLAQEEVTRVAIEDGSQEYFVRPLPVQAGYQAALATAAAEVLCDFRWIGVQVDERQSGQKAEQVWDAGKLRRDFPVTFQRLLNVQGICSDVV